MGRDRSRSRERRGDRDRDEKGRGSDRRDDRGDDRRDDRRDDRGGDRREDRGDERRRERSGEKRSERSIERAAAAKSGEKRSERSIERAAAAKSREDKDRDRPSKKVEPKDEKDDDEYRVGRQVMVKGLKNNADKNGSIGNIVEFNKEKGRWVVAISGGNNNFKEENLELMADNSDVIDENEEPPTTKVYITNLAADVTDKDLLTLFGGCGLIERAPPKTGPKGFRDTWPFDVKLYKPGRDGGDACVTYMDGQSAKAAIKSYHRYKFKGSKIGVAYAGQGKTYEKKDKDELQKPWYLREENQGKLDREGGGGGGKGGKDGGKDGGKGPKPGDWKCEDCGADVFASKDSCFKCGSAKPSGGGGGGGSSYGKDGGKGGDKGGKGKDDKGGGKGGRW